MNDKIKNIDFEQKFFGNSNIKYSKSKDQVWAEMELKLSELPRTKKLDFNYRKIILYSAAAILFITISLGAFLRFYTEKIYCPNGQHTKIDLPDGSKVTLNANSGISYYPYWWRFKRELTFEGEAFFEVKKGKRFIVKSELASTLVMGTSFNIYARNNEYKVNCLTGKVMVITRNNNTTTLIQNEYSVIEKEEKIVKSKDESYTQNSIAWIKNEFIFTSVPLKNIYEEIERQFDIEIIGKENLSGISSFNAKRGSSPEEMINLIGKPFGVKCIKISERKYIVEQK